MSARPGVRRRVLQIPGPPLEHAFTVLTGAVAVRGLGFPVIIPTGGTWPGTAALEGPLEVAMQPYDSNLLTPDSAVGQSSAAQVAEGLRLILVQALSRLKGPPRLKMYADLYGTELSGYDSIGCALNMPRETIGRVLLHGRSDPRKHRRADQGGGA